MGVLDALVKTPFASVSSCAGEPTSAATPWSITSTVSQSMMVCRRCAAMTAHSVDRSRLACTWCSQKDASVS